MGRLSLQMARPFQILFGRASKAVASPYISGQNQFGPSQEQLRAGDESSPTEVRIGDAVYNGMGESFRSVSILIPSARKFARLIVLVASPPHHTHCNPPALPPRCPTLYAA